jgi:hypothetical protein
VRILAAPLALAILIAAPAAVAGDASADDTWPYYQPKLLRWEEDYGALAHRPGPTPPPLGWKYLPLLDDGRTYLSIGAEYRLRVDDYADPDFGLRKAADFTSLQQRMLLHGDLHVGEQLRLFVQLGDWTEEGRKPAPRPSDHSEPDIAQAFLDLNLALASEPWRLRVGRQEVAIGRYIAVRDATNIRRTFDGLRLDGRIDAWSLTGLAAHATRNRGGSFDDEPDPHDAIAGLVAEAALPIEGLKLSIAGLDRRNDAALYAAGAGRERRETAGVRVYGSQSGWDMDGQASYQFGSFTPKGRARMDIDAWGAAFEGGFSPAALWRPRLALRADYAGGDDNRSDGRLSTFDLPYPNLSYLTDAAIFAPRNVHDLQPFVSFGPDPSVTFTLGAQFLWRNSAEDSVYSPANTPVIGPGGHGMYVATEPYLRLDWRLNPLLEVQAALVRAYPGTAIRSFGGRSTLDFAYGSLDVRF